jgi:hypothetical protein
MNAGKSQEEIGFDGVNGSTFNTANDSSMA